MHTILKTNSSFIAFFVYLFLLLSCENFYYEDISEIVPISSNLNETTIIVNGSITSENKFHSLTLTKPMSLNSMNPDSISGAHVYLVIETDTFEYQESIYHNYGDIVFRQHGTYISKDSISGKPNCLHSLHIEYKDKVYIASDTMIKVKPLNLSELKFYYQPDLFESSTPYFKDKIILNILCHHFGYKQPNIYQIITVDKYLNKKMISTVYHHNNIDPQGVLSEWNKILAIWTGINDSVWIIKHSISQPYENFLIDVFKETEWKTGFFSEVSANPSSNVTNGGMGYFYASDIYKKSIPIIELKQFIENE